MTDWNEERVCHTSAPLTDLESVFRSLQPPLGTGPPSRVKCRCVFLRESLRLEACRLTQL